MNIFHNIIYSLNDIKGQDFENYEFISCKFEKVNFRFVSFKNCKFRVCDLSSNHFDLTTFTGCSFSESKLSNLDFTQATVSECDFTSTILKYCVFQRLKSGSSFEHKKMDLRKCNFTKAELTSSIFNGCNLANVNFSSANLDSVVFDHCNLKEANLADANITGTNFSTSLIEKTVLNIDGFITYGLSKGFIID